MAAVLGTSETRCAGAAAQLPNGPDPGAIPAPYRAAYETFAHRCSRCHAVDRALAVRHGTAAEWRDVVDRMRRLPHSGIASADVRPITEFLVYFSTSDADRPSGREGAR
jgi:hypothetical protein